MGENILIAEDRPDTRNMISFALKKEGYLVLEAEDGKQAVEMVDTKNIDMVLLDLMLPKLSGEEVLKHIRSKKENNKIKVLIITASKVSETEMESFKKKGADGVLLKPINIKDILNQIKKLLERVLPVN